MNAEPAPASLSFALALAVVLAASGLAAGGCGPVTIEKSPPIRLYDAGKARPRLHVLPLDDKSGGKVAQGSLFLCKIKPETTEKIRSHLIEICQGSGLFSDVQPADWSEKDLVAKGASLPKEGEHLVLIPTIQEFKADGHPHIAAYIVFPLWLFAALGLPAVPYEQDGELQVRCRFVDARTGKLVSLFDTGKIIYSDTFPASYTNAPGHLRKNLETLAANLGTSFAGSLSAIRGFGDAPPTPVPTALVPPEISRPPVKELLRFPSDVTSPTAEIKLLTPPTGIAIRDIKVTVNDAPSAAKVRTEDGAIIFQLEIGKGNNKVELEVLYLSGEKDTVTIEIKRSR